MKTYMKFFIVIAIFVASCFMTGCQEEANPDNNQELLDNSSLEIEEYIIAGLDYKHALDIFNSEIKDIDFLKLSTSQDSKGNTVVYIPTSVNIEEKSEIFNEKKKLLLDKCPQIISLASTIRRNYFQQHIQNSSAINEKVLELGIVINQPRLKDWSYENHTNDSYCDYLDTHLKSSEYVEIVLIVYEDGTTITYMDSRNTSTECWYPVLYKKVSTGKWYTMSPLPTNSPISYIAHTHSNNDTNASSTDIANSALYPGLTEYIYTSGCNYTEY
jgi:hypothetical protein